MNGFTLTKTVYHFSSILLFGTVFTTRKVNSDHKRLRNTTREVASRRNPERKLHAKIPAVENMFRQFPFSSQPVTVTPLEKLKKHHEKDIVLLR